jgi:isopenicillin-N N-acyltransferase like protein
MADAEAPEVIELSGTRLRMGEAFGEHQRAQIHALYALRLRSALQQAHLQGRAEASETSLLQVAQRALEVTARFDPETFEELTGIARGSGLGLGQIMALNGLTDLRDVLSWWSGAELFGGCSAIVAQRDTTAERQLLCGQTWDLGTDNQPFVVGLRRRPDQGPASVCLSISGSLPFLGINAEGVAVGTTNLRTRDAQPGVVYVTPIDRALRARSAVAAVRSMRAVPRAGGHFFYVADGTGAAYALECTARRELTSELTRGIFVHTNHCLAQDHHPLDVDGDNPSSQARLHQLQALAEREHGTLDAAAFQRFFRDTSAGVLAICRDDVEGTSTNAAAIFSPHRGAMLACVGLPSRAGWFELIA